MVQVQTHQSAFRAQFQSLERAGGPAWLRDLRSQAMARFEALGFPTTRREDWKYTNVAPIANIAFAAPDVRVAERVRPADIEPFTYGRMAKHRLVFVNGRYAPALSGVGNLPEGAWVGSIAEAVAGSQPGLVQRHLARYADHHDHAFPALNTALFQDGAMIVVPPGQQLEDLVHLIFLATLSAEPVAVHPRTLVIAGEGSEATVVESYVSLGKGVTFTNAVTELALGQGAHLRHYKLQNESDTAYHVGVTQVHQERDSVFHSFSLALGGKLARNDLNVALDGEGAECHLDGLYYVADSQHVDNHTLADHVKPHTTSRQLYKGVLDSKAKAVFNGKVIVRPNAVKSDAHQTNRNLLLSNEAEVATKPQLEIFNDDVKCSHGDTVGQTDREALFYLRSRGMGLEAAQSLLTYGFASEVIDRITLERIRTSLQKLVAARAAWHLFGAKELA